uniref:Protein amnionless n=1 Tax=Plectus sambesii TaxID=2011161 RepID=A0A914V4E7_9BILA
MLGNDMEFGAMVLPLHGSILFGDNVLIGVRSDEQCTETPAGKEQYFQPEMKEKFYHDGRNWMRLGDSVLQTPLLHVEQVPSDIDTALFFEQASYRVQIDSPVRVGQLNFSGT